jgi:penicillin G amidase
VPSHPLWQLIRQVGNVVVATCAALAVLALCAAGFGRVPALGRVLDPGHGAWTSAAGGQLPASETLRLSGLTGGAIVTFDSHGIASIDAASEADAMIALGYTHAAFRLAQMDLERRLAEGRLAQLVGPSAVPSDEFELRLGLLRTARREWAEMPKTSAAAQVLDDYSIGVNDYLAHMRETKRWPTLFSLAGVYPADWSPVDSLAVQGVLTQELDYTTSPLDYAVLARSLGLGRTMQWFPVLPVDRQSPYDPGPYHYSGIAPIVTAMTTTGTGATSPRGVAPRRSASHQATPRLSARHHRAAPGRAAIAGQPGAPSAAVARAAAAMLTATSGLPAGQILGNPGGDAWVANGPKVSSGSSMLAADPSLAQRLPSSWFEVALAAPGFDVAGASVPGLPGVLVGHNRHIAWSFTDTQNQAALYYVEQTSKTRPGLYFWEGKWRAMRRQRYTIYVRGGAPRQLTVYLTVHGPVMTQAGRTVSVDWMGNVPSPDVAVLQQISTAHDFSQFRAALAGWRAPAQDFVYADDAGNIGAISAGYYPIVRHGAPWLPMPGTGADDVAGVIPYSAVPSSYDPASNEIVTADQRPVTAAYPYYIGSTATFDPGYRASREQAFLSRRSGLSVSGFAALQASQTDELAVRVLPRIEAILRAAGLTAMQREALALLRGWNDSMDQNSAAAAIWWTLWSDYLRATFEPWWQSSRVPVLSDPSGLAVTTNQSSLDQVLEQWTLADPANPAFGPPGVPSGTAVTVLRQAFATAVAQLHSQLGGVPSSWSWGSLHSSQLPSPSQEPGLGYGPRPAGGDPWTVDAAYGLPVATDGPGWRMIIGWQGGSGGSGSGGSGGGGSGGGGSGGGGSRGGGSGLAAVAIYPGGQSENPASPWYENLVADSWNGTYLPMPMPGALGAAVIRWEFEP